MAVETPPLLQHDEGNGGGPIEPLDRFKSAGPMGPNTRTADPQQRTQP